MTMAREAPRLPAELFHRIIDLWVEESSLDPATRMEVLATCSRVSWLFHLRSQTHRFSNIHLLLDNNADKRAERLFQAFIAPQNKHLLPLITSLTIIIVPNDANNTFRRKFATTISQKSRALVKGVKKRLGMPTVNSWVEILFSLISKYVESLLEVIITSAYHKELVKLHQFSPTAPIPSSLFLLTISPGLEVLTFKNVTELPLAWLIGAPGRLRKLNIINCDFLCPLVDPYQILPDELSQMVQKRFGTLEELNWICAGAQPRFMWPTQIFCISHSLPSLTTLILHLSPIDMATDRFLEILPQAAAATLQRLEIHNVHVIAPGIANLTPDFLSHFKSLNYLGYKAKTSNTEDLRGQMDLFSKFLSTAQTSMPPLSTISLEIVQMVHPSLMTDDTSLLVYAGTSPAYVSDYDGEGRWALLDEAMCNPNFTSLRTIRFHVRLFQDKGIESPPVDFGEDRDYQLQNFMPKSYRHPMVDVVGEITRVERPDAYDSWLYETHDVRA